MTSFFCRLIELKATHVIWTVDTLTSQLSSSELAGGSFLRGSVLSRQYGGLWPRGGVYPRSSVLPCH